jgi:hypothetical protein
MNNESALERRLRKVLVPVLPRKEFVADNKRKFGFSTRMPVEMEHPHRMKETVTLATLGLGAVASIAAVATIGVKVVNWIGSDMVFLKASKTSRSKEVKPSLI